MKLKGTGYVPGFTLGKLIIYKQGIVDNGDSKIILVKDLSIEKVVEISDSSPSGIIVVGSQNFSHTLIYLFSTGIPTVLINSDQSLYLYENADVFINGNSGMIYINPNKNETSQLNKLEYVSSQRNAENQTEIKTQDGTKINLFTSINSVKGASDTIEFGGHAIGLLRSELLFANDKKIPSELNIYNKVKAICDVANTLPITIRLFDFGGEKIFKWIPKVPDIGLTLGVRGSRLYSFSEYSELLENQLVAISKLVDFHNISILIPYLSSLDDLDSIITKIIAIIPREKVKIGAMLETTSMSLSIPEISQTVDFLAIGTNDLCQSFFGVDRSSSLVSQYFDLYSPSLIRLFSIIGSDSINFGVNIRICGQLSLFPYWMQLLIGMGFREFSIEPAALLTMKKLISTLNIGILRNISRQAVGIFNKDALYEFLRSEL
jgi:phosphoenolpyruvate-protein kinase (PTS system EI component)